MECGSTPHDVPGREIPNTHILICVFGLGKNFFFVLPRSHKDVFRDVLMMHEAQYVKQREGSLGRWIGRR